MHGVSLEQAVNSHVTSDGHAHGPLKAYFTPFNASTTAKMSNTLMSAFSSGRLGCIWEIAFTGAPGNFLNLLTNCETSDTSG